MSGQPTADHHEVASLRRCGRCGADVPGTARTVIRRVSDRAVAHLGLADDHGLPDARQRRTSA